MRILGIDPGSTTTGYGLVEKTAGRVVHVAHGRLRPPRGATLVERLTVLGRGLEEVVAAHAPDAAALEGVFVAANPRSALVLGQARGALLAALGRAGLAVAEYDPRTVKQCVAGSGAVDKQGVQEMVRRSLGLARRPAADAADALAVALCHVQAGRLLALGARRTRPRRRAAGAGWVVRRAR